MIDKSRHVGVISQLIEKHYEDGKPYFFGKVESVLSSEKIWFHQKNLKIRKDSSLLKEGQFILFENVIIPSDRGDKLETRNCTINCELYLEKNILSFDLKTIEFIFLHASVALKSRLINRIELAQDSQLRLVAQVKNMLPGEFPLIKDFNNSVPISFVTYTEGNTSDSFLDIIFRANNEEYNIKLFATLVEGLVIIENLEVYIQAKFLMRFNSKLVKENVADLPMLFYQKATNDYKFLLWLENYVDFCSTDILRLNFQKGSTERKKEILERCKADERGYLVGETLPSHPIVDYTQVFFKGIRQIIIGELVQAKSSISVAVAWFTNDELFGMLCMKLEEGVTVELIIINDYINNWEYGLPFQKFVDLGGKLFFSEYPGLMHNKFCIIDDVALINGSYNWTYYAELYNEENIVISKDNTRLISHFVQEFNRLKNSLGDVIKKVVHFEEKEVNRFERFSYREYLSNDIILKAEQVKPNNPKHAGILASFASKFDTDNTMAVSLGKEIEKLVMLESHEEIVRETLKIKSTNVSSEISIDDNHSSVNEKTKPIEHKKESVGEVQDFVPGLPQEDQKNNRLAYDESTNVLPPNNPKSNSSPISVAEKTPIIFKSNILKSYIVGQNSSKTGLQQISSRNITGYSLPIKQTKANEFVKLKVGIALDISSSMEKLYKSGVVQQVVEKLLALALTMAEQEKLDLWTFNNFTYRKCAVTKENFSGYIMTNNIFATGSTNASLVLSDIIKKYFVEDTDGSPVFVIIITDGDVGNLQQLITQSKNYPLFWQFVGLGDSFDILKKLDDLNENISFFSVNNIATISDEELYEKLLTDFPVWFKKNHC